MNKNIESIEPHYVPLDDYENYYYSNDIDVASTLICKRYELVDIIPISQNKATFVFKNNRSISTDVEGFWGNRVEVRPLEFANVRKNLKSRIFGMKKAY